jgi:diketogulonate reductase-like aldo/keto reductase
MDMTTNLTLRSGNRMPIMGLGTYGLDDQTADTVEAALKMGWRMFDTSGDYDTQPGIGQGLKQSGLERGRYFITTKVEEDDDAYEAVMNNLKELDLDFVDLVLIHRPPPDGAGEDLWHGLIQAKLDRLTRDIGVSNYNTEQIGQLIEATGEVPAVNQIEWTPFGYSQQMLQFCREHSIIIQAYSPLTRGKRLDSPVLKTIAQRYGKTPAQVLLRWNVQMGTVPLPKANQLQHLEENADIFDFRLNREEMERLNGLNEYYSSWSVLPYIEQLATR